MTPTNRLNPLNRTTTMRTTPSRAPDRNTISAVRRAYCPECGARPYERCQGVHRPRAGCHRGRWNAYRDLTTTGTGAQS